MATTGRTLRHHQTRWAAVVADLPIDPPKQVQRMTFQGEQTLTVSTRTESGIDVTQP